MFLNVGKTIDWQSQLMPINILIYEDLRAKRLAEAALDLFSPLPGVTDESIAVWQEELRAQGIECSSPTGETELAVWQAEARKIEAPARPISNEEDYQMLLELM